MAQHAFHLKTRFVFNEKEFSASEFLALNVKELWLKEIQLTIAFWLGNESQLSIKTSGSTGLPKSIELDKRVLRQSAKATLSAFNLKENNSAVLFLPAQFIGGKMMVIRALIGGLRLYLLEPKAGFPIIKKQFDFVALTPMQASNSLLQLNNFKQVLLGGGPVSASLLQDLQSINAAVFHSYGMTETASHVALRKLNGPNASDDFVGVEGVEFSVDDRQCLHINAPLLAAEKLQTNDVVALKSTHVFVWKGRVDNVINSGGVKIYPEEIEKVLEHQISAPFFISSLPDEKSGERLVLFVEERNPENLHFDQLLKLHQPKEIIVLEKFVYTNTNKINRQKTQENYLNAARNF